MSEKADFVRIQIGCWPGQDAGEFPTEGAESSAQSNISIWVQASAGPSFVEAVTLMLNEYLDANGAEELDVADG